MISIAKLEETATVLSRIESIAVLSTASSTNVLARRVIDECLENDIPVPQALIVAREQRDGRGRESRVWISPRDGGLWSTTLATVSRERLALLPLEAAIAVSEFVRTQLGVENRLKWPNDVLVGDRKIAGVLIEARSTADDCHVAIGVGINISGPSPAEGAITAEEARGNAWTADLDEVILAWAHASDELLVSSRTPSEIVAMWSERSHLMPGDHVASMIGGRRIDGSWLGIDEAGHARIATVDGESRIAAGDIVRVEPS